MADNTVIPRWKKDTIIHFTPVLQADETIQAVTGGLLFGCNGYYYLIALTDQRLILLEQEDWLGRILKRLGWQTRQTYSILRPMIDTVSLEASETTRKLHIGVSDKYSQLEFEQVALGAEELESLLRTNTANLTQLSTQELIEQAQVLKVLGLETAAINLENIVRQRDATFQPEKTTVRWQEQQYAYRVAGIELSIILAFTVILALFTVAWTLETFGEFIIGILASVFLLQPLFAAQQDSNTTILLRLGLLFLFMTFILLRYGDWLYFVGTVGIAASILLLLTGKANPRRTQFAIACYVIGLAIFGFILFTGS